jgi:PAS domain S-box-containing protein
MLDDLTEPGPKASDAPAQELEGREGVEDFGYSPLWPRSKESPAGGTPAASSAPQLTLAQALDLLEVEAAKRQMAEEGLREKEERFRQMSRYLGKFLWLSDAATNKLIYVSPGYEQVWRAQREGCYARPEDWLNDTPPKAVGQKQPEAQADGHGDKTRSEYQAVGPDGSLRWIRERMYPIQDAAGNTLYTLGIAEDITDLKNLEGSFQKNEIVKRAFLRLVPDTILRVRGDGTILEFKAAKDDDELKPVVKLRGRNLSAFLSEPVKDQVMHCIQRALSTGRIQSLSLQHAIAGVVREFDIRSVACGDGEVLAIARDVTSLKGVSQV